MRKKSFIITVLVFIFCFVFMVNSAMAGSKQRERWKGVAIGVGAAIIGSAILNSQKQYAYETPCIYSEPGPQRHQAPGRAGRGHWETRKEWVPPVYENVWNPGHYDKRGRWVEGHWIKIVDRPGYWIERRMWVAYGPERRQQQRRY